MFLFSLNFRFVFLCVIRRSLFIWDKFTGDIVRIIPADDHIVNCVQPHPNNYPILAISGIDSSVSNKLSSQLESISFLFFSNIKIFSPISEQPIDDSERINRTLKRNYAMPEDDSNTITMPAGFLVRMLTSMNHLQQSNNMFGFDDSDDE